jgi:hypothetical protein
MGAVSKFEEGARKKVSMVQFFQPFANCNPTCSFYKFPTSPMESIRNHGSIPVLSWSSQSIPSTKNEPDFQLSDVISGRYDNYIREFATQAKGWNHPFFLRFNWEMNTTVFPWSYRANGNRKGEFAASWRRVWRIFHRVGARNATWVWCPNADFSLSTKHLRALYPGDRYVDWTCLDAYNWSQPWRSFETIIGKYYRTITRRIAPSKPVIIGEAGTVEQGGNKALWFAGVARALRHFSKVRGFLYFDFNPGPQDWRIETSLPSIEAFRSLVSDPRFVQNRFPKLRAGRITPP